MISENEQTEQNTSNALWTSEHRLETISYLFIFVWGGYLLLEAQTWSSTQDWLFPAVFGVLLCLLAILKLLVLKYPGISKKFKDKKVENEAYSTTQEKKAENPAILEELSAQSQDTRSEVIAIVWILVLPFFVYYFGFVRIIPIYLFTFFWYHMNNFKKAVVLSAIISSGVYILFKFVLDANLWPGKL